jgi:pimeloyl-ACP methyl ester carboxylesterase
MSTTKAPIVLIHGLWMTPSSWDTWAERFRAAGHEVLVPSWPGLEGRTAAEIRHDPTALKGLGITRIVDHYESLIRAMAEQPIIMGHSFGGLFTQMLLDRGLGVAGVGVDPGQPAGITTLPASTGRSGFPVLSNPFNRGGATPISKGHFHYTFGNDLTRAESDAIWEAEAIPSSNTVFFEGVAGAFNEKGGKSRVDWAKPDRAPLLITAGSADHVVPPAISKAIVKRYSAGPSKVDYQEFAGRTHRIVSQDGWEEVADFVLSWAVKNAR